MSVLQHTALHDWHLAHGGRMVDFAGWHMPVQYSTIVAEHQAVRRAAGLFDIAHMGRLRVTGHDAVRFLNRLTTNDVSALQVGQAQYSLVTNEAGGILDDVLVYRFPDFHLVVVNASNRLKILEWIGRHLEGRVRIEDLTRTHFMLALQGPRSRELLQPLVDIPLEGLKYYRATQALFGDWAAIVSRTGYTGEDGFELIVPVKIAPMVWETLSLKGAPLGLLPAGLGCRDTLRLEAAMPLYGHELDENTDPFTAGLDFAVKLDKGDFLGRAALVDAKGNTSRPRRVGLKLAGKRIAREGVAVLQGGNPVGRVTSGTFSPTLEQSIAMAYVAPASAAVGAALEIDIRGQHEPAQVVKLPFYKRK